MTSVNEIKAQKGQIIVETRLDYDWSESVREFLFNDGEVVSWK